ncbi:MAG: undecaprenyl diphosphate synthase family protein [Methanomicrobiales archaeon]|nr:undecaprenyl diphosphate synthase family protein [Methanomicrobiales archaeon]
MLHWLYEWHIARNLKILPEHICFMIAERDMEAVPEKIREVAVWCRELGMSGIIFHISTPEPPVPGKCLEKIRAIGDVVRLTLLYDDTREVMGSGIDITVAIGLSGREEITRCIRAMARDNVDPETIDEHLIEAYLTFHYEPDLVIKTGGDHLTDFLIWQSVYSEIFFSDVNWKYFRKVDFLRALRDYQFRKRRFGK